MEVSAEEVPILHGHDHRAVVGKVYIEGGKLRFHFEEGVPDSRIFEIFGSIGFVATESHYTDAPYRIITHGDIVEWSIPGEGSEQ